MMTKQRGFSLIEALIALVVLSFGLIGMAAMQLKALQSATQSYQRSVVTLAAVDAQERLWAELGKITQNISGAASNCSGMKANMEDGWESDWFESDTPIQNFTPGGIDNSDCEFTITIELDEDKPFTYIFRLPDPEYL